MSFGYVELPLEQPPLKRQHTNTIAVKRETHNMLKTFSLFLLFILIPPLEKTEGLKQEGLLPCA